ncbi:hypothetical protein H6P81_017000 [Aristolochia fimbriata]|uniref:Pectinesterase inhibitor domain-containing protein n=1 Tax=Aristolochia fimbriata TaxID=158543 RepID=A0AAV7DZX0_ARIFI|nr:hypothetical protein H6P81_017000 [Aristolochia fimbriata]
MALKSTVFVFPLLLLLLLLLRVRFSAAAAAAGVNDIQNIRDVCQYTEPNRELCVSTLSSDARGATADRRGLAEIALDTAMVNASENVLYTQWLASKARGRWRREGYRACRDFFNLTVRPHTLQAEFNFHKGDYDNAIKELSYCLGYSQKCGEAIKNLADKGHTPPLRNRVELQMNLCEISQVLVMILRIG